MVKCLECKKEVSEDADKCPHCGSTAPTTTAKITGFISAASLAIFFYWMAKLYFDFDTNYLYFI